MPREPVLPFDVAAEVDLYFDESSVPRDGEPRLVVLMGGVATGKTTIRKQRLSAGHVLVDAGEIFLRLSRGERSPFPGALKQAMNNIGNLVARRAINERRHIVTELIGADLEPLKELLEAMRAIGYSVAGEEVTCDIEEAQRRALARRDDTISCHYAEPYQRRWLLEAARGALESLNHRRRSMTTGEDNQDDVATLMQLASELVNAGRFQPAVAVARRVTELAPDNPAGWFFMGSASLGLGEPDEAELCLERALRCDGARVEYCRWRLRRAFSVAK